MSAAQLPIRKLFMIITNSCHLQIPLTCTQMVHSSSGRHLPVDTPRKMHAECRVCHKIRRVFKHTPTPVRLPLIHTDIERAPFGRCCACMNRCMILDESEFFCDSLDLPAGSFESIRCTLNLPPECDMANQVSACSLATPEQNIVTKYFRVYDFHQNQFHMNECQKTRAQ
jgi:hypothetical protein